MPEEISDPICKGESADGYTMEDFISLNFFDINDLKSNNVIKNIVEITGMN